MFPADKTSFEIFKLNKIQLRVLLFVITKELLEGVVKLHLICLTKNNTLQESGLLSFLCNFFIFVVESVNLFRFFALLCKRLLTCLKNFFKG